MMTFYVPGQPSVQTADLRACASLSPRAVWIDLLEPTREEELAVEAAIGQEVPTRDEMQALEPSSRLYQEGKVLFMAATLLAGSDTTHPERVPVSFILAPERVVTVRYAKSPRAFEVFAARWASKSAEYDSGLKTFKGLLDAIVERLAEVLERTGEGLDQLSLEVLSDGTTADSATTPPRRPFQADFQRTLRRIGRLSDLASRARESLVSLSRLLTFFREAAKNEPGLAPANPHMKAVADDLTSLGDHASFLSSKVSFLLDATLGLINNEQNGIIKIVSVAAVVFLPPTLVASIYGMNFKHMPELGWRLGYPMALVLMLVSAILPYVVFRRKGWL
ncbi:MAG TPA: magnesium transporter CorA family protein [Myxococcaceae bacterium]|jgi:magnesium transporter|nr:magnesium transporter CorA family protein [Myxococcaceae bacterium]